MRRTATAFARRAAGITLLSLALTGSGHAVDTTWDGLAFDLFGERPLLRSGLVSLEAPERAHDAALVPITVHLDMPEGDPRRVERVTLVVDENPAPVAGTFTLGEGAEIDELSTRVRVNAYSPVHVVAELSDGTLHVAEKFVKASGGCAAPMGKDPDEAMASMGRMKLRDLGALDDGSREAQLMIRHPNNSGFQRDPITLYYIPAHFVSDVTVKQGEELILSMEGGISLSEDPSFRFDYRPNGEAIRVEVRDTEDNGFAGEWPVALGDS